MKTCAKDIVSVIAGWVDGGEVSPSKSSLSGKISEAYFSGKITADQKSDMMNSLSEVIGAVAWLRLAGCAEKLLLASRQMKKFASEVDADDVEIAEGALNGLGDMVTQSGDDKLVMFFKVLTDIVEKLKKQIQTSQSGEQLQYEHAGEIDESR